MNFMNYCKQHKGGTFNQNLEPVEFQRGFMCSLFGTERRFERLEDLVNELYEFKQQLKTVFFIGVWFDEETGLWFLDNSKLIYSKKTAIKERFEK